MKSSVKHLEKKLGGLMTYKEFALIELRKAFARDKSRTEADLDEIMAKFDQVTNDEFQVPEHNIRYSRRPGATDKELQSADSLEEMNRCFMSSKRYYEEVKGMVFKPVKPKAAWRKQSSHA